MNIEGKVAVITGGASGMGRASAELFVSKGAKVALFDMSDEAGQAHLSLSRRSQIKWNIQKDLVPPQKLLI